MPRIHFLNVGNGSCSVIQHGSGRVSVIDICNGSAQRISKQAQNFAAESLQESTAQRGDFRMRDRPTNPVAYLKMLGVSSVFRFIMTHPDMDHMDGLKSLHYEIRIENFWDSGVRKEKPDFGDRCPYKEEDWDLYEQMIKEELTGVTVVRPRAGGRFRYANQNSDVDPKGKGDCLTIVAPDRKLAADATESGDANDGSYVIVYRTCGGKIVFGGDAHDDTWEYVLENYHAEVVDCAVLIAPHHGRDSRRSYDFLEVLRPQLTLFGCAPSEHMGYQAWCNRDLQIITSNQAGNIILDANDHGLNVSVENEIYARKVSSFASAKDGYSYIGTIVKTSVALK